MRLFIFFLFLLSSFQSYSQEVNIIPQPASLKINPGNFILSKKTVIAVKNEEDKKAANFLNQYLKEIYGFELDIDKQESKNFIRIVTKQFIKAPDKDAYRLHVTADGVTIEGDTHAGTFYGMQSLIQLLPFQKTSSLKVPLAIIEDAPRFTYRGMHLDVGRHFFPASFIKKYIDYLALHKMNYFHWHLTEDQGWRIEIKKYPKLTQVGAYRNGTIQDRYPGTYNDNKKYGGFYTQEEVKEIVQYAADRHITVVPEIEMPGHSSAAIAAYPFLSCFPNEPTKIPGHVSTASQQSSGKLVQETWGVFEDIFCAGNDETFNFLQDVLDEVLVLFPSQFIHVGGDEVPKTHWKKCPICQQRIKDENLKNEAELQSYFIQRVEKYLNSKGRILIGWDEILEGGLAPNAVVMSWQGEKGGIAAAKENHFVIMSPNPQCYFNYSQTPFEDSVTAIWSLPLKMVYDYDPIPKALNSEQAKFILGAQGNVWTEYINNPTKVEYTVFPRMSALSEVLWSDPANKNWDRFEKKLFDQFKRYELWNTDYHKSYFNLEAISSPAANGLLVKFETRDNASTIYYSLNGRSPIKYSVPVTIKKGDQLIGYKYKNNLVIDSVVTDFSINKATGKKVSLAKKPHINYPGNGAFTLVDGVQNKKGLLGGREFVGYLGSDLEAVIDLGTLQNISTVSVHSLYGDSGLVYPPSSVEVYGSADGKAFKRLGITNAYTTTSKTHGISKISFNSLRTRHVKILIKNIGTVPAGKPGEGNKAWLFVDEIEIN